jgi:hypothetical protein
VATGQSPFVQRHCCTNATEQHWDAMASLIRPFGHICTIAESGEPWDLSLLKSKSVTFSQEFMFTRALFQTPDMIEQHRLLPVTQ